MRNVPRLAALAAALLVGATTLVASEDSVRLARVVEKPEDLATVFADAQTAVTYDSASGRLYYPTLGMYFDPATSLFFDPATGMYHDSSLRASSSDPGGMLFDSVSGMYYDTDRQMNYNPSTMLYHDEESGLDLSWNDELGEYYDPVAGLFYDRGLGVHLAYDSSMQMFYDQQAGMYYDLSLGLYYDNAMGLFYDSRCGRYYDKEAGQYYNPATDMVSADPGGHLQYEPSTGSYFYDLDGCYYVPTVDGLYVCSESMGGEVYLDPNTGAHLYWDGMRNVYSVRETGDLYDGMSQCYYDSYNWCYYRFDSASGGFVDAMSGTAYNPYWQEMGYASLPLVAGGVNASDVDTSNMWYDDMWGMYFDPATGWYYDDRTGLYFDGMSYYDQNGSSYWYDSMQDVYVNSMTGAEYHPPRADNGSSSSSVNMANMWYDDMWGMYYDPATGWHYDERTGLYFDGMSYYDQNGSSYWYDSMQDAYVNCMTGELYRKSQNAAASWVDTSGMWYDDMYGMYYDPQTGMHFDATVGLYYDGMNYWDSFGNSYWHDEWGDCYYNAMTGKLFNPSSRLAGLQVEQIKLGFMALAYDGAFAAEGGDASMSGMDGAVKIEKVYYVAPFGAADAFWFDRLFRTGMDFGRKTIRLSPGIMPLTLMVEWAEESGMGGMDFTPSGLTVTVSEQVWRRIVHPVEFEIAITWNTMYMPDMYFWNGCSMAYGADCGCAIEGVDSQEDVNAYALYGGDNYYDYLFSAAVYRGCWQSPWYEASGSMGDEGMASVGYSSGMAQIAMGGQIDTDGDGVSDVDECLNGTNPFMFDTDCDGMSDGLELRIGSNPCHFDEDSDGDGMADVWENCFGLDPENAVDANADTDRDGLRNFEEYALGTNPLSADTDSDGIRDKDEVVRGMNPVNPDTDNDGVPDGVEIGMGADPKSTDSDGDGLADGEEMYLKTNPCQVDSDGDGLSDYYEFIEGLNPNSRDSDGDGLDDDLELYYGTDPCRWNSLYGVLSDGMFKDYFRHSAEEILPQVEYLADNYYLDSALGADFAKSNDLDGDGLSDWCELLLGTDPLDPDTDLDGLDDGEEFMVGTAPLNPDTDGDGLSDWDELACGANPMKECSLRVGLKDGFAIRFDGCDSPLEVMTDGRTAYEHVLYTGDVYGEIDDNSALGSGQAMVTFLVKSYVGNPATLHVGDLEIPLLPNAEIPIKVNVPVGEDVEVYSDFRHWEYGDWDAEDRYRSEFGNTFDYYNEKVEFMVVDANEFTVFRNDYWNPGDDRRHLLTSYRFPEFPLCIHDKENRELDKYFEDVQVDTYWGDGVVCNWELVENTKDVEFTDMSKGSYSVAVHVKASFPDSERRHCRLTYQHPNYVAGPTSKILEVRYCPEFRNPELSNEITVGKTNDDVDEEDSKRHQSAKTTEGDLRRFTRLCPKVNETNSAVMVTAPDQLILRKYKDNKREYFADNVLLPIRIIDHAQVKYDEFGEAPKGQCCPCPDHAHNHVDIFASSRVELFGENFCEGTDSIVNFPDTIYTVGKRPSCDIGDALVLFTTNGAEYVKHRYTVLGVNIEVPNVDLDYFNLLSDELGMPMLVGTNVLSSVLRESDGAPSQTLRSAPILDLKCNVGLKSGVVRLSLGKVKGHFKVVAVGKNNDVTVLMDTEESKQVQWKLEDWWKLVDSEVKIRLVAVTRGSCDVHFSYGTVRDGKLYRDAVSQRFTAVYPLILPDYNRDGKIDDDDAYSYQNGRMYYFWENDDTWEGDNPNATSVLDLNNYTSDVHGRYDVINLTPLAVCVRPFSVSFGMNTYSYELTLGNTCPKSCLRYVPVAVNWSDVNAVHRVDQTTCEDKPQQLHGASLINIASSDEDESKSVLNQKFLSNITNSTNDLGCIVAEFPYVFTNVITLVVRKKDTKDEVARCSIPTTILNSFDMMRWVNIRHIDHDGAKEGHVTRLSTCWPDSEHANANVIFIHGFNVNEKESIAWAKSIFKKFWWSGLDAGFTAVSWPSCVGQISIPVIEQPNVTYKYYQNIINAYDSAKILPSELKNVPGEHYVMAHSLGNMLVSISRQDYDLQYKQFFMMNAAVAMETYDTSFAAYNLYDPRIKVTAQRGMTNSDWWDYDQVFRCNHWYELFPESDGRHNLTWKGRFKDVDNTVNYYSSEDEVLMNGDGTHERVLTRDHVWYNQEHLKGCIPGVSFCAGWNFKGIWKAFRKSPSAWNERYRKDPEKVRAGLRKHPIFKDFRYAELQSENGSELAKDYKLRAETLSFDVPAETFAVGANPVPAWGGQGKKHAQTSMLSLNVDMSTMKGQMKFESISRTPFQYTHGTPPACEWAHAYFATMPYQCVHKVFEDICKRVSNNQTKSLQQSAQANQ